MERLGLKISGIVQGVGFRPFLWREAARFSIKGFVQNTAYGVYAEIEGEEDGCAAFLAALYANAPPLARVDSIDTAPLPLRGDAAFLIRESEQGAHSALISPDIGICEACRREILDPANRRYRYAFTNCTDCGPRFTIIRDIPYDRPSTTMAAFLQCPDCQAEYGDPADRRFHAQPNACPVCGPRLTFASLDGERAAGDPLALFDAAIGAGKIVAVKGLGGFHLACDARNEAAVTRLRLRKARDEKPFALMLRDVETARRFCALSPMEEALLTSPRKPIVLLKRENGADGENALAPAIAPGNARLGVMLPYTPLHCLLMEKREALVLTSGNVSERPMVFRDEEVSAAFAGLADALLTHERAIVRRMDDSVALVSRGAVRLLRRARGYVPEPIPIQNPGGRVIFAAGAQQKNAFCLVKGSNAFLSGHIGELDDPDTERSYREEVASFFRLFDAAPEILACDPHPDYLSTRFAGELGLPLCFVQHHRAHFASVLAEHGPCGEALGFIFDGTGLGDDGTIWGGETFLGTVCGSARVGSLLPFPLLGGEAAVREPWRAALAVAEPALGRAEALALVPNRAEAELLLRAREAGINAPRCSSMGRLFDAVAAIASIRQTTTYEGQAAVELEQAADPNAAGSYRFAILEEGDFLVYDWRPLIRAAAADARAGAFAGTISMRFHRAVAALVRDAAIRLRERTGCGAVALSGGCFMNEILLTLCMDALEGEGFSVFSNEAVPVNDGGIAYGQAAAAAGIYGG